MLHNEDKSRMESMVSRLPWLESLRRWWRPPPITTATELEAFARQRAAFIAQKVSNDYCQAKTGAFRSQIFKERTFLDALDVCRWEGFAAVLADVLLAIESFLRPAAAGREAALAERLFAMYKTALAADPTPAHRPDGWTDAIERARPRLLGAALAERRSPAEIALDSGHRLFDSLPIHMRYRELDEEMILGAVQFQMLATWEIMRERLRAPALVSDLLARTPGPVAR
jgi:hypothetical protein